MDVEGTRLINNTSKEYSNVGISSSDAVGLEHAGWWWQWGMGIEDVDNESVDKTICEKIQKKQENGTEDADHAETAGSASAAVSASSGGAL